MKSIMIKKIALIVLLTISISSIHAQRKEKIKGSKEISTELTSVEDFTRLLIGEDFKVTLVKGETPLVEITTNDNLHEVIQIEVVDNTLLLKSTKNIVSKKQLKIRITYTEALNLIETKENGQISSINTIDIPELTLKATGSSKLFLTIKSDMFKFINSDKARAELNVTANTSTIELSDNSKLEALINSTDIKIDLYQRANAQIEGDVDTLNIRADNSTNFIGKNLASNTCSVLAEDSSDIYIQVIEEVTIDATGSSEIFLYEDPKIIINTFEDTVKLHKKEL